jgi:hypothetical protein
MPSYAEITVLGHIGKIEFVKDEQYMRFSVAVSRNYNKQEHTDWFTVMTKTKPWLAESLFVGDLVEVKGTMTSQKSEKNGNTYWTVWANRIYKMRGRIRII